MSAKSKKRLLVLSGCSLIVIFIFMTDGIRLDGNTFLLQYLIKTRYQKLLALLLTAFCIAVSTLIFQTITDNRILTPSIMGLDNLYVLIQTVLLYGLGSQKMMRLPAWGNYCFSLVAMLVFSYLLFRLLFRYQRYSLYFMLLTGTILNTLFASMSSFLQMIIDPNDYLILQSSLFASFNAINTDVLFLSGLAVFLAFLIHYPDFKYLDVLWLGKEKAVNLGLPYNRILVRFFLLVSLLVSVSTSLVGPITFLGLLLANLAYQLFKTYKHSLLLPGAVLLGIIALVGGQYLVESIFALNVQLTVVLNLLGGSYFIIILLKEGGHL
ncbi:iron chelate uptake ABC transporter family permease subunit [Streptococcus sp. H49]|uniref:iron chelate uptake ABC transporter family permease subunit n=1 Tax=Streptococcus huangxiaojuni TaxID=3237239 RepID=UPI0034A47F13